ncbi:MAG: hypothetical protein ACREBI_04300 [Nitrosotalea sp.]
MSEPPGVKPPEGPEIALTMVLYVLPWDGSPSITYTNPGPLT